MLISKTDWGVFLCVLFICFATNVQCLELSGKIGGFFFTSDDPDFTDYYASSGYLVGGRVSFRASDKSSLIVDVEDVKSERSLYFGQVETSTHVLSIQILYKNRLMKEGRIIPYIGGGFGISRLRGTTTVGLFSEDVSWDDFAFKSFIGFDLGQSLFLEAGYMSGGRNGNTGVALSVGFRYFMDIERKETSADKPT